MGSEMCIRDSNGTRSQIRPKIGVSAGDFDTPVVASRLKSNDHHAERDGYFERLPSLRDSKMNARAE